MMKYTVGVDDNFHFMDEAERDVAGEYESAEEAVVAAREIVEKSLKWLFREGMTAAALFDHYRNFGDDPFIVSEDRNCHFSAWIYAEQRSREICAQTDQVETSAAID